MLSRFHYALLCAAIAAIPSLAQAQPSFDCRKAGNATEKAICADTNLARLDRQLSTVWKSMINGFDDNGQIAQMKADQNLWATGRNACGVEVKCIAKAYTDRLKLLTGSDPNYPAAGVFEVKDIGSFVLYPVGGEYLVSIQTADPKRGAWTCDVAGRAKQQGSNLQVTYEQHIFQALLKDSRTLVVESGQQTSEVEADACGLNGTVAFIYTRPSPKEPK